jgi:hypothetical protein
MNRRLVVVKNGKGSSADGIVEALAAHGWQCETIELARGEPLPKGLGRIDGLFIVGDSIDVYDPDVNPMQVYLGS